MLRKLLIGFGLVEITKPEPIIGLCERIGLRNPSETRRRPLALTGARLEGLAFVWLLIRGRQGSTLVSGLLGLAGLTLVLVPQPIIDLSQQLVYANTDDLELQPWVVPAARLLGVLYLTVTLLSRSTSEETAAAASETDADSDSSRLRLRSR
ncbi:hypothetical protein [Natrinema versiforme]|uniref:Uncharacterized protein n=1 Tax=Natrinema versiforme JCM 10478 TaxID=1227496 RepID=L9XVY4_9EURY|nr:hypothetical protein [Natrinema versiforme]ELY65571.1 hypothetical protein C489_14875 [Natrinema versiforme JCM 10478]